VENLTGNAPGKQTIAAVVGVTAAIALVGLIVLGGQTSSILSNVGNAIGDPSTGGAARSGAGGAEAAGDTTDARGAPEQNGGQVADADAPAPDLLIIRTGTLTIEVDDLDAAVAAARDRVAAVGGFVSGSDQSSATEEAAAAVTFRIPAGRWDDALAAVRDLGRATRALHVETEAVTNQVVDLGARITNLRATEAALQGIMTKATKIPDVLDVQAKLTDVRGEIEQLVAEKAHLENQAAYGTLTVTFVLPATPVVEEVKAGWDPAADADAAAGALIKIGQRLLSFGIWAAIVGLPILLALGALLALAFVAWRLIRRASPSAVEP
jgi:uncharacterized protein DUF4349